MTNARKPIALLTQRLRVREPIREDAAPLTRVLNNPKTMKYIGDGSTRSQDRVQVAVDWYISLFNTKHIGGFIVERLDDNQVIGDVLLLPILHSGAAPIDPETGKPNYTDLSLRGPHIELGYRLHPDAWGQGFATEAAKAVFGYATHKRSGGAESINNPNTPLPLNHIVGVTHPDNTPSQRVLEKLGFTYKGLSNRYYDQPTALYEWHR